jgi:competence protein ComEA
MESIRERLAGLERRELVGLLVVGVLIVGGMLFWYARSLPSQVRVDASVVPGGAPGVAGASAASPTRSPGIVVVYVSGWVRHPGVFQFHQGERVIDAIRRAGGVRMGADVTSINLAALLTDAMQITVGKRGAPGSGGVPGSGTSVGAGGGASGDGVVNINTSTLDQLDSLPGIGPTLAQRIIDYREQHGPFRKVEDLLNVSGIGDKKFADLRAKVTV